LVAPFCTNLIALRVINRAGDCRQDLNLNVAGFDLFQGSWNCKGRVRLGDPQNFSSSSDSFANGAHTAPTHDALSISG
jgi:hypothetical protein